MKCLKCNKAVGEPGKQLDNGSFLIEPGTSPPLEEDDNGTSFMRCKHCGAKNIIISDLSEHGPEKLSFLHYIMDDE